MKRLLLIFLLTGIVAAAGYTLFTMGSAPEVFTDPWNQLPEDTQWVLEFPAPENAWHELSGKNQVWKTFRRVPEVQQLHELLTCLFASPQNDAALNSFISRPMLLAGSENDQGQPRFLWILAAHGAVDNAQINVLLPCAQAQGWTLQGTIVDGTFSVAGPGDALVHGHVLNDLVYISNSKPWLAEVGTQRHPEQITPLRATLGAGVDAHLIGHTKALAQWSCALINNQANLVMHDHWVGVDIAILNDVLLFGGVRQLDSTQNTANEEVGAHDAQNIPAMVTQLYSKLISAPEDHTYPILAQAPELRHTIDTLSDKLFIDLEREMTAWISGQLVWGTSGTGDLIVAEAIDGLTAGAAFDRLTTAYTTSGYHAKATKNATYNTYAFNPPLPYALLGSPYANVTVNHVAIWEDVVLLAGDQKTLLQGLSDLNGERTLASIQKTSSDWLGVPTQQAAVLWSDPSRITSSSTNQHPWAQAVRKDINTFTYATGNHKNGYQQVSAMLGYAPKAKATGASWVWRAAPIAQVVRKPDILLDHTTSGRNILLQDTTGTIHFFQGNGEKLWERSIGGNILGGVHQVDRYKNGKLQMLFNTATHLHLIDRNGNNVEGFPIAIEATTAAPMALIDYDGDKNYRLIVVDTTGNIHNHDIAGKVVAWDPIKINGATRQAVQHLRVKTKDFLLLIGASGKVHLLDRQGKPRYQSPLVLDDLSAEPVVVSNALTIGECGITWKSRSGSIKRSTFNGNTRELLGPFGEQTHWTWGNMDGDGITDHIRTAGNNVRIDLGSGQVIEFETPSPIVADPTLFNFGEADKRIGLTLQGTQGITLFNARGELLAGYPLEGSTPFSISDVNGNGKLELVTLTATYEPIVHPCP